MWWLRPGTSCGVFHQIVSFSVAASTFWRPIIPGIDRESHRCEAPSRDIMIPTLIWKVLGKSCKSHSGQTIHRQNFSPTFSLMCIYIWLSTVQYTINTLSALRRVLALCIILRVRIDVFEADLTAPLWSYLKRFIALFNCFVFSFVLCAVFSPPPRFPLPVSLLLSCIWWFWTTQSAFLSKVFSWILALAFIIITRLIRGLCNLVFFGGSQRRFIPPYADHSQFALKFLIVVIFR